MAKAEVWPLGHATRLAEGVESSILQGIAAMGRNEIACVLMAAGAQGGKGFPTREQWAEPLHEGMLLALAAYGLLRGLAEMEGMDPESYKDAENKSKETKVPGNASDAGSPPESPLRGDWKAECGMANGEEAQSCRVRMGRAAISDLRAGLSALVEGLADNQVMALMAATKGINEDVALGNKTTRELLLTLAAYGLARLIVENSANAT